MGSAQANRFVKVVAGLALIASIGGCATSYQKSEFWGMDGYSSKAIREDTVEIQYMLSQPWNFSKVLNFALFRAAEMTTERGFHSFKLLDLKEYTVGSSKVAKCTVQFFNPSSDERRQPETADQRAAYELVGSGIYKSGDTFVASELKKVIAAKHMDEKK